MVTYVRPDNYKGYSKINHYHMYTKLECEVIDNSWYRENGVTINGKSVNDKYVIHCYNYKGVLLYTYSYDTRDEANLAFKNITSYTSGWKRID